MDYADYSKKIYNHLISLEETSPIYLKQVLAYSSVLEKLFPQEFKNKLNELKIFELMIKLNASAGEMIKSIDSFNLNIENKTIEVVLGEDTISEPLVDIKEFIINKLKLEKNSEDYFLVLSYLIRNENFELFQITQAIILGQN